MHPLAETFNSQIERLKELDGPIPEALTSEMSDFSDRVVAFRNSASDLTECESDATWYGRLWRMCDFRRNGWRENLFMVTSLATVVAADALAGFTAYSTYLAMRDVKDQYEEEGTWSEMVGHVAEWGVQTMILSASNIYVLLKVVREERYKSTNAAMRQKLNELEEELEGLLAESTRLSKALRRHYREADTRIPKELRHHQNLVTADLLQQIVTTFFNNSNQHLEKIASGCWLPKPGIVEAHLDGDNALEEEFQRLGIVSILRKGLAEFREHYGSGSVVFVGGVVPAVAVTAAILSAWGAKLVDDQAEEIAEESGETPSVKGHVAEWSYNSASQTLAAIQIWIKIYEEGRKRALREIHHRSQELELIPE